MKIPTHINRSTATLLYMLFVLIIVLGSAVMCDAQSATILSKTVDIKGLNQLNINLGDNVVIKTTSSSRIVIERKLSVQHTKSELILSHIVFNNYYDVDTLLDINNDTVSLSPSVFKKLIKVDNEVADVKQTYVIYIPKHIKVLQ